MNERRGTWALCAVMLAACGSSSIAVDDLPAQEATAVCAAEQRCLGLEVTLLTGDADCAMTVAQDIQNGAVASLRTAIAAGTVTYDGAQMPACLDAIRSTDCSTLFATDIPACMAAIQGTIAPGGRCSINLECSGNAYCRRPTATMAMGTTCPGTCVARVGVGQMCMNANDCTRGLYCDRTRTCSPRATEGLACLGATGSECAIGLDCVGNTMTVSGTCHTTSSELSAAAGTSCDLQSHVYCMAGLSCAVESVGPPLMERCEMPVAAGAPCKVAVPEMCPLGQYCLQAVATAPDGTCAPLPAVGEPCRSSLVMGLPIDDCLGDATCIVDGSGNRTCRAKAANGGACTVNAECWSDYCSGSTCAEPEICH